MNKDRYKSELNNIKPDERLVRNTIHLIKENQERKERKSFFTFNKFAVGLCSLVIVGSIGYATYNYNTNTKESDSSKEKDNYASSTIYKIEEENSNILSNINEVSKNGLKIDREEAYVPSKAIKLNKMNEKSFNGMYLVRQSNGKEWSKYKHTNNYEDYKKFIKLLDSVASENTINFKRVDTYKNSSIYIYDTNGEAYTDKNTMRVKINNQYMIYLPVMAEDTIVVQLLSNDKVAVYEIKRDMTKEDEYAKLRDFVSKTGTEIEEDERELVNRNVKVYIDGKEDKSGIYNDLLYGSETSLVRFKYTREKEALLVTFLKKDEEVANPKVAYNKELNVNFFRGKVKDATFELLGNQLHPYLVILTKDNVVYYINTKEWAKTGNPEIVKVVTGVSKIESGSDSNGYIKMYGYINGKKTELEIGNFDRSNKVYFDERTTDADVKYDSSDEGRLYVTFKDGFKKEIKEPKVELNKKIEVSSLRNQVKDLKIMYIGKDSYPQLIVLTNKNEVYLIKTSEWVSTGICKIKKLASNATKIETKNDSNGNLAFFATIDGKSTIISLN